MPQNPQTIDAKAETEALALLSLTTNEVFGLQSWIREFITVYHNYQNLCKGKKQDNPYTIEQYLRDEEDNLKRLIESTCEVFHLTHATQQTSIDWAEFVSLFRFAHNLIPSQAMALARPIPQGPHRLVTQADHEPLIPLILSAINAIDPQKTADIAEGLQTMLGHNLAIEAELKKVNINEDTLTSFFNGSYQESKEPIAAIMRHFADFLRKQHQADDLGFAFFVHDNRGKSTSDLAKLPTSKPYKNHLEKKPEKSIKEHDELLRQALIAYLKLAIHGPAYPSLLEALQGEKLRNEMTNTGGDEKDTESLLVRFFKRWKQEFLHAHDLFANHLHFALFSNIKQHLSAQERALQHLPNELHKVGEAEPCLDDIQKHLNGSYSDFVSPLQCLLSAIITTVRIGAQQAIEDNSGFSEDTLRELRNKTPQQRFLHLRDTKTHVKGKNTAPETLAQLFLLMQNKTAGHKSGHARRGALEVLRQHFSTVNHSGFSLDTILRKLKIASLENLKLQAKESQSQLFARVNKQALDADEKALLYVCAFHNLASTTTIGSLSITQLQEIAILKRYFSNIQWPWLADEHQLAEIQANKQKDRPQPYDYVDILTRSGVQLISNENFESADKLITICQSQKAKEAFHQVIEGNVQPGAACDSALNIFTGKGSRDWINFGRHLLSLMAGCIAATTIFIVAYFSLKHTLMYASLLGLSAGTLAGSLAFMAYHFNVKQSGIDVALGANKPTPSSNLKEATLAGRLRRLTGWGKQTPTANTSMNNRG